MAGPLKPPLAKPMPDQHDSRAFFSRNPNHIETCFHYSKWIVMIVIYGMNTAVWVIIRV